MEKKIFNKLTKEVFEEYGFKKCSNYYLLLLDDISIVVRFSSWRCVKYFNYSFAINDLYDESIPYNKRFSTIVEIKMEHTPTLPGYKAHEIVFEEYDENQYREMLTNMLHRYFDPYKNNAIQYIKENEKCMCYRKEARLYLGLPASKNT